ncbi:MAG: winged helix-turn-helix transcriptional regulator [Polyangiaceae bacterium]
MTDRRNASPRNSGGQRARPPTQKPKPRNRSAEVPTRRSYGQYCGLAHALDVVGERWTLLILRDLLLGPRRYGTLLSGLQGASGGAGITTNLLAKRLRELEASGLIARCELASGAAAYGLSPLGEAIEPAIQELARWGGAHFMHGQPADERLSLGWMLLNLKRKARPTQSSVSIAISDLDGDCYTLSLNELGLDVKAGVAVPCAATLTGDPLSIHRALFRGESVSRLKRAGLLHITGDIGAVRQLTEALTPSEDRC